MLFAKIVAEHEPDYCMIWKLDYTTLNSEGRPAKLVPKSVSGKFFLICMSIYASLIIFFKPADEKCKCTESCDDRCYNR